MVVYFVDIGGIVVHYCLNFLFIKYYCFGIVCLVEHDNIKTCINTVGHTSQQNDKNTPIKKYSW